MTEEKQQLTQQDIDLMFLALDFLNWKSPDTVSI